MKILVTGGCGFIGSHTVALLIQKGHEVVIVDDMSTGSIQKLEQGLFDAGLSSVIDDHPIELWEGLRVDGSDEDLYLIYKLVDKVDAVLHLAALVSVKQSVEVPEESFDRNMRGFFNVLYACKIYKKRLVYASSAAVYGSWVGIQEESRGMRMPLSPYAADKTANDLYASTFASLYKFPVIGLRYFNVYGPRQDPKSDYAGVIGKFIDRALTQQPITIFGDGKQTRNFVNVKDVARINVAALLGEEGFSDIVDHHYLVNVGCVGVDSTSINELAEMIKSATGNLSEITHGPSAIGDIKHSLPSLERLSRIAPEISKSMTKLDDGIVELITYLRNWNQDH